MDIKEHVHALTGVFLSDEINFGKLFSASRDLRNVLQYLSGGDYNSREIRKEVYSPNGKATAPFDAALCLDDVVRTRQFMRGVYKAIGDKLDAGKEVVNVLYAGTGPFASLVLPALLRYPKERVHYTLIEINPLTARLLRQVVHQLGLNEHTIDIQECDASSMQLNSGSLPDVVVSETMQNLLAKEQQVSVFLNLMRQTPADTIFIPERIDIYLGLLTAGVPPEALHISHFVKLDKLFELSRKSMQPYLDTKQPVELMGETSTVVSAANQEGYESLLLLTEIVVYGSECILVNQSGLTTPKRIKNFEGPQTDIRFSSRYRISAKPVLEYELN